MSPRLSMVLSLSMTSSLQVSMTVSFSTAAAISRTPNHCIVPSLSLISGTFMSAIERIVCGYRQAA
jgi:hypothetical protein